MKQAAKTVKMVEKAAKKTEEKDAGGAQVQGAKSAVDGVILRGCMFALAVVCTPCPLLRSVVNQMLLRPNRMIALLYVP